MKFSFFKKFHLLEIVFFLTNLSVLIYAINITKSMVESFTVGFIFILLTTVLPSTILHNALQRKPIEVIAVGFVVACNIISALFWSHIATDQRSEPLVIIFFIFHWIISYLIFIFSPFIIWFVRDVKKDFEK